MHTFNWVDLFIIAVVGLSIIISLVRGFVREALSLAGWIVAIWVAMTYYNQLADILKPHIKDSVIRMGGAFLILLFATLIVAGLVNFLISQLVAKTGLSGTDRMIGAIFGFIRGALLVGVLIMLSNLTPLPAQQDWKDSLLVPTFKPVEVWLARLMPADLSTKLVGTDIPDQVQISQTSGS